MNWNIPNWRLVAMMPLFGNEKLHWILAENNGKFVISLYNPGDREWVQGHYFDERNKAFGYWMTTTIENTPISDIESHRRFAFNIDKLVKIANALKGVQ